MKMSLYSGLAMLLLAGMAFGAANWSDGFPSNSFWDEPTNWVSSAVPVPSDSTFIRIADLTANGQGPIIDEFIAAKCRRLSLEVNGTGQTMEVTMTGGTLDIYYEGVSDCYFRLGAGEGPGAAIMNMSGGTMTVNVDSARYTPGSNGYIRVGSGYTGQLNLSGEATVTALDLIIAATPGTHVDLRDDATLVLAGDDRDTLQGYLDTNLLTAYNNPALVQMQYYPESTDPNSYSDVTVLTAMAAVTSFDPTPADSSIDADPNTDLSWTAGADTISHDIYFGDDYDAVLNADNASPEFVGNQAANSIGQMTYNPAGWLAFGNTYYWRVDDVKNGLTEKGAVWQFTVANYLRVSDAFQVNYDNTIEPYTSQVQLDFSPAQDWTAGGVMALEVAFTGDPANDPNEGLFVTIGQDTPEPNSVTLVYTDMFDPFGAAYDNAAIASADTSTWQIPLQQIANAGIDLTNIGKLVIGFGDGVGPGAPGTGSVTFEHVRLYPPRCFFGVGAAGGDLNGDCVVDLLDWAAMASNWLVSGLWP